MGEPVTLTAKREAELLGLARYFTGKPCVRGHVSERSTAIGNCVVCQAERNKSDKQRAAVARLRATPDAREKARHYSAKYHAANRDECLSKMQDRNRAYYARNREAVKAATSAYQRANTKARTDYKNQWCKDRKVSDPQFAALTIMRKMVARACERIKMNRREIGRTVSVLGYKTDDFRAHIEAQFKPGMSWANHGDWHVDHIKPLAKFDLTKPDRRQLANALANLQPLWAAENMAKGARE